MGVGGTHGLPDDLANEVQLPGQYAATTLPGDLRDRAAEVEVHMVGPVVGAQLIDGPGQHAGIGSIGLHAAVRLIVEEGEHGVGLHIADHQPTARDHLAHAQSRTLLVAQRAVGGVGHPAMGARTTGVSIWTTPPEGDTSVSG